MKYKTEQEDFWAGGFGEDYISRNDGAEILASNLSFFSNIFQNIYRPNSLIEFGANIGMNLKAIKLLYPKIEVHGIEINRKAANILSNEIGKENVTNQSILDFDTSRQFDISLIKGVLIHINPESLEVVYRKIYDASKSYILICEYYNPTPVMVTYRGHQNRLFKRDFAGEMMDLFKDLTLVKYGFAYKRDPSFPMDDLTWFLIKKNN